LRFQKINFSSLKFSYIRNSTLNRNSKPPPAHIESKIQIQFDTLRLRLSLLNLSHSRILSKFQSHSMRHRKNQNHIPPQDNDEKKTHLPNSKISDKKVFLLCLATRLVNAFLVQTYFNPDEHWQALEVAHKITFG
jgi:hypothetical protein